MEGLPCQWGNIYKITDMFYPRIVSIFQKGMKEAIYILAEKFALDRDQGWYQLPAVYNSLFQSHAQSSFQGGVHWTHQSRSFYFAEEGTWRQAAVSATFSWAQRFRCPSTTRIARVNSAQNFLSVDFRPSVQRDLLAASPGVRPSTNPPAVAARGACRRGPPDL